MISDENLKRAIFEVNRSHRWNPGRRPNHTVQVIESDIPGYVTELRNIIEHGFVPGHMKKRRRYDHSAGKWRDICEPLLWPDQYVHHAIIQTLEPVLMRGMDHFCCGSIKNRGTDYGKRAIEKWMRNDPKGTKYCMELDIHHFYDSLKPETVMQQLKRIIKDRRVLDVAEQIMKDGIQIGVYSSQWFANTALQPLDRIVRCTAKHYVRYMDNFTIFGSNRRELRKLFRTIRDWLSAHGLSIKDNWQLYPTISRLPNAMGYRYGIGYTRLRKRNQLRITRQISRFYRKCNDHKKITAKFAAGLLSRIGQLKQCRHTQFFRSHLPKGLQKTLKKIVRRKALWNTFSAPCVSLALS